MISCFMFIHVLPSLVNAYFLTRKLLTLISKFGEREVYVKSIPCILNQHQHRRAKPFLKSSSGMRSCVRHHCLLHRVAGLFHLGEGRPLGLPHYSLSHKIRTVFLFYLPSFYWLFPRQCLKGQQFVPSSFHIYASFKKPAVQTTSHLKT